jgi:hypothetical protein
MITVTFLILFDVIQKKQIKNIMVLPLFLFLFFCLDGSYKIMYR